MRRLASMSVIIPTLNESPTLGATVRDIRKASNAEVLVVDGGSVDGTPERAEYLSAKVLLSARGRARQMNVGARAAGGDVLLFLHADTRLPPGFEQQVFLALSQPGVAGGAFRLRFNGEISRFLKFVQWTANLRSHYLKMPFGDQGIFLSSRMFREIGGFPDIPLMEDLELVRRLRKKGRITIVSDAVVTSTRRYAKTGVSKRVLVNKISLLGYYLGVSPQQILRWYETFTRDAAKEEVKRTTPSE